MGRRYVVTFEKVSCGAAQDLFQIKGAAGKVAKINRAWCGMTDTTLDTAQALALRCRYLPATVTDGSGGSTPSFQALDPGDAAASVTALANNTTKATTNGTAVVVWEGGVHLYAGAEYNPYRDSRGAEPVIIPSTSFVFELLSTVTGTVTLSGGVEIEELG